MNIVRQRQSKLGLRQGRIGTGFRFYRVGHTLVVRLIYTQQWDFKRTQVSGELTRRTRFVIRGAA